MASFRTALLVTLLLPALAGCELVDELTGARAARDKAAAREAEGRAIGAACRQVGRSMEDCIRRNEYASKDAVFQGWRDMNDYMRENKMEASLPPSDLPPPAEDAAEDAPSGRR